MTGPDSMETATLSGGCSISDRALLEISVGAHEPTRLNRQSGDVGMRIRSVTIHRSSAREEAARAPMADLRRAAPWDDPIVTKLVPHGDFDPAEAYRDEYFAHNAGPPYCRTVVAPKVAKFRQRFTHRLAGAPKEGSLNASGELRP